MIISRYPTRPNVTGAIKKKALDSLDENDLTGRKEGKLMKFDANELRARGAPGDKDAAKAAARAAAREGAAENARNGMTIDEDNDLTDLAKLRGQQLKERRAASEELAVGKAKALQQGEARANLGGMGLSGATAAQQSDIGRTQDRSAVLAEADLERKQRDEQFTAVQRLAALSDLEEADNTDYNQDGTVGKPLAPGETKEEKGSEDRKDTRSLLTESKNITWGDADTAAGSIEEPFKITTAKRREMEKEGFTFTPKTIKGPFGDYVVFVDQDGFAYTLE